MSEIRPEVTGVRGSRRVGFRSPRGPGGDDDLSRAQARATARALHPIADFVQRRVVFVALAIYLLFRGVSFVIMTWIAHHQDPAGIPGGPAEAGTVTYWDISRMWDGEWYRKIATGGYPDAVPRDAEGNAQQNELAFYPLYPLLVRLIMSATGGSFAVAGGVLSLVLGCLAVVVMAQLLTRHVGAVAALCGIAVYASSPPAPSLQMAYTESLAMLLLCSLLLALDTGEWILAATLAIAVGIARPIGIPLAVVALVVIVSRWRSRERQRIRAGEYVGMAACLVACGASGLIWPVLTWTMTGERGAYSETMGSWRSTHEVIPFEAWWRIAGILFSPPWGPVVLVAVAVGVTALIAGPWSSRLGLVMHTWCAAYVLYLFAVLEPWSSLFRYLLELFPLAVVLVGGARAGRRSRVMVPLTVLLVLLNTAGQAWWAWNFLRLVPPVGNPI